MVSDTGWGAGSRSNRQVRTSEATFVRSPMFESEEKTLKQPYRSDGRDLSALRTWPNCLKPLVPDR